MTELFAPRQTPSALDRSVWGQRGLSTAKAGVSHWDRRYTQPNRVSFLGGGSLSDKAARFFNVRNIPPPDRKYNAHYGHVPTAKFSFYFRGDEDRSFPANVPAPGRDATRTGYASRGDFLPTPIPHRRRAAELPRRVDDGAFTQRTANDVARLRLAINRGVGGIPIAAGRNRHL